MAMKGVSHAPEQKADIRLRLEFELADYDVAVQSISPYTTENLSSAVLLCSFSRNK